MIQQKLTAFIKFLCYLLALPLAWTVHFFFFTKGWSGRDSDQKDLTNKSEIKFGSMHNVFTFAIQKKTT